MGSGHTLECKHLHMHMSEDHVNVNGVGNAYTMLLWTSVGDMGRSIVWSIPLIMKKFYNVTMVILDFLAAIAMWFQSVADESSSLLPCVMPCWPGGSDYGPPEVEIDDISRRIRSRKGKLLKIKESLNVKHFVKSTSYDHHECTVCLSEFCNDEIVYELPQCQHIFHQPCLNQWLQHRRTTCPLCRSSLQPAAPAAETLNHC